MSFHLVFYHPSKGESRDDRSCGTCNGCLPSAGRCAKHLVFHLPEFRAGRDFPSISLPIEILDIIKGTGSS